MGSFSIFAYDYFRTASSTFFLPSLEEFDYKIYSICPSNRISQNLALYLKIKFQGKFILKIKI